MFAFNRTDVNVNYLGKIKIIQETKLKWLLLQLVLAKSWFTHQSELFKSFFPFPSSFGEIH